MTFECCWCTPPNEGARVVDSTIASRETRPVPIETDATSGDDKAKTK